MQCNTHKPLDHVKRTAVGSIMNVDIIAGPYAFLYKYIKSMIELHNYNFRSIFYKLPRNVSRFKQLPEMNSIPDIDDQLRDFLDLYKKPSEIYGSPIIRALTAIFNNISEDDLKSIFSNVYKLDLTIPDRDEQYYFLPRPFMNMNIFAGVRKVTIGYPWQCGIYERSNDGRTIDVDFGALKHVSKLEVHDCILSDSQLSDIANCCGLVTLYHISANTLRSFAGRKQLSIDNIFLRDNNYNYLKNYDDLDITHIGVPYHRDNSALQYIKRLRISKGYIEKDTIFHCDELTIDRSVMESIKPVLDIKKLALKYINGKSDRQYTVEPNTLLTCEFVEYKVPFYSKKDWFITDLNVFMNVKFLSLESNLCQSREELYKLKNVYALRLCITPTEPVVIYLGCLENVKLLWIYGTDDVILADVAGLVSLRYLFYCGCDLDEDNIRQIPSLVRYTHGNDNLYYKADTFDAFYERYQNGERW
jgi:hypothetical protein